MFLNLIEYASKIHFPPRDNPNTYRIHCLSNDVMSLFLIKIYSYYI